MIRIAQSQAHTPSWVPELQQLSTDTVAMVLASLHRRDESYGDFAAARESAAAVLQDRQTTRLIAAMKRLECVGSAVAIAGVVLAAVQVVQGCATP